MPEVKLPTRRKRPRAYVRRTPEQLAEAKRAADAGYELGINDYRLAPEHMVFASGVRSLAREAFAETGLPEQTKVAFCRGYAWGVKNGKATPPTLDAIAAEESGEGEG